MSPKACYNCIHGKLHRGIPATRWQPEEPDEIECTNTDVAEEVFDYAEYNSEEDEYVQFAKICGYYEPVTVTRCGNCDKPINQPLYSWDIWEYEFVSGEPAPMCSDKCKQEYKAKQDKKEQEGMY